MSNTNLELVDFAKKALVEKWGYCLGTFGQVLSPALLQQKLSQGSGVGAYNTANRAYLNSFMGKRVSDCYGLVKGFVWWNGGNVRYVANQDRNQEGAFNSAKEKGPLSNMPEIPGLVLWMKGHAGIYIGNGEFIECKGAPVGMIKGKITSGKVVSGSPFTHWFKDTYIDYIEKQEVKTMSNNSVDLGNAKIKVNNIEIKGITINGVSYAPVRALAEAVGKKVEWDAIAKTVFVK